MSKTAPASGVSCESPVPQIDPTTERICSVKQAAEHFQISVPTAWRLVLSGRVASFKIGNSRRTSLEAFSRACQVQ